MSKYSKRTLPSITNRQSEDELSLEFLRHLQKQSVQPKAQVQNLQDQMYSIINGNKPRYPSVDAAVKDMLDRTGLSTYKQQLRAQEQNTQTTSKRANIKVELFEQVPQVQQTIDNYIQSTHGNLLVPEILDYVRNIHKNDVPDYSMWSSPALLTYINEKNIEEKKLHPDMDNTNNHLGQLDFNEDIIDPSNTDALHALNPASTTK